MDPRNPGQSPQYNPQGYANPQYRQPQQAGYNPQPQRQAYSSSQYQSNYNAQPQQQSYAQGQPGGYSPRPQQAVYSVRTQQQYAQQPRQAHGAAQPLRGVPAISESYHNRKKNDRRGVVILLVILAIAALAVGGWFLYHKLGFSTITVNGTEYEVKKSTTPRDLITEGYVVPEPGDLLAIDGSILTPGGGEPFALTVNGVPMSADLRVPEGADVQFGRGADVTENCITTEEVIPAGWIDGDTSAGGYYAGSIHLLSDGQDGLSHVKRGAVSGITFTEVVNEPIDGGYHVYTWWADRPVIALTFDDGPWPTTTWQILDLLEQYGAKATFFTIGYQIYNNPEAVQRAAAMGCQICTHSYDHANGSGQGVNLTYMSAEEQVWEIQAGYQTIIDCLGYETSHVIRAPGGNFYGDIVWNVWPYVDAEIGWDIDTMDWSRPGVDAIVNAILSAQPGQVVLMHDGGGDRSQTVEALARALPILVEQGYQFVTCDELIAMSQGRM